VSPSFWRGKRVLLTGHTGFKGSWLALWLNELGAKVTGYALAPPTSPNLFEVARVGETLDSILGDIRDPASVDAAFAQSKPEIIFHLAAQPLVSEGYQDPVGTYATNLMGTLNIMQAARHRPELQALVVITTDKCYENAESLHAYIETDPLGGHDPYSSSKACADIAVASWRRSFFSQPEHAGVASARAGNVIGGGDWAKNRLVPDMLRAFAVQQPAQLRHIQAVRPWQHVLEPLAGYLLLAEKLCFDKSAATAWNFGPELEDCVSVERIADQLVQVARLNPEVRFVGLDASPAMLECAQTTLVRAHVSNVELVQGDMTRLIGLEDGCMDGVICTMSLHHLPDHAALCTTLREVRRVLKPQGRFYLVDFGRLKLLRTQRFFADDLRQPPQFTEDYFNSLRAAFSVEELSAAVAPLGPDVQRHVTVLAPFLMVFRSAFQRPMDWNALEVADGELRKKLMRDGQSLLGGQPAAQPLPATA